jgi:inward rectifier potassium channel
MARRTEPQLSYRIRVIGGAQPTLTDAYHWMLRVPIWATLLAIVACYVALNLAFALAYLEVGGIANAHPGSFSDAFFFSIQTLGTIGYGALYPVSRGANVLVASESVLGLLFTAAATGLVFVRFSRIRGRVMFSEKVAIGPMDGVPTLQIRVGNERTNRIFDAEFRLMITRTGRTAEGVLFYRTEDLALVRSRAHALSRSWTLLHRVEPGSPLHGATPESVAEAEVELVVAMSGVDETALQPIHARYTWEHPYIAWGARLADILSETKDEMVLDLRGFHELVASEPIPGFPYPRR